MKLLNILLFLVLTANFISSAEISEPSEFIPGDVITVTASIKQLEGKINNLQTKEDSDTSFLQLDEKITNQTNQNSQGALAFIVAIVFLNDLLILAGYFLLKNRGLFY